MAVAVLAGTCGSRMLILPARCGGRAGRGISRPAHTLLVMDANPADLVRSGYNALSHHYRSDDNAAHEYDGWLAGLRDRLPGSSHVLDIGCGCGIPVARHLTAAGHQVTGIDISDIQIERARQLAPGATFIRADATELDFPARLFQRRHLPLHADPPAARPPAPPAAQHRPLAAPRRLAPCHHRAGRLDRHPGQLARRTRHHVVEPRRRHPPSLAPPSRPGDHQPAVRSRGRQRPRPLLGTSAGRPSPVP